MKKTKVILVGEPKVGKTSIINQYVESSFSEEYLMTLTGDKLIKEVEINGSKISLEIWDTAGNEKFRAVNKIFMKNTKIAILVYDITDKKSFEELSYWYNQIITTNDKNNIIIGLAGNKNDKYEEQQVPTEEGQKYADKINAIFSEISAMDHESIEILFNKVLKVFVEKEKEKEIKYKDNEEESKDQQKNSDTFNLDIKNSKKRKDDDCVFKKLPC